MFFHMCSVYHQFMVATVQTLIVSTTEPLDYILFPKIVVCNKYKLRSVNVRTLLHSTPRSLFARNINSVQH
jgi:hypothetical protein